MKTSVIQLERFDDVLSIKDRITWSRAPRILLVWPRRGRILRRLPDLVVVERACRRMGAQLALAAPDAVAAQHAQTLGIPVFDSAQAAQNVPWRRPSRKPLPVSVRRPPRGKSFPELRAAGRSAVPPTLGGVQRPIRWGVFLLGAGAVSALLAFLLPWAEITVHMPEAAQELEMEVWASPDIATPNLSGGIPAYPVSVTVEGRDDLRSSGRLSLPSASAEGAAVFTNLTDAELYLPAGTVVLALEPGTVRFETTRAASMEAGVGNTVEIPLRALLPGLTGNVPAGAITAVEGGLGLQALVNNPEPLTGGAEQSGPAPSAADAQVLRRTLLENLRANALAELAAAAGVEQHILSESVFLEEVVSETLEPGVDQPADRLNLTMRVVFSGLAYRQIDLETVARLALDANLPPQFTALPGSLKLGLAGIAKTETAGKPRWRMRVVRKIRADAPVEAIRTSLVGQTPQHAAQALQAYAAGRAPRVAIHPRWWPRLPYFWMRVKVVEE